MRRLRILLFAILATGVAFTVTPRPAHAQGIPTVDREADGWWGVWLAQRLAHVYGTAAEWRDVAMGKARGMIRQARRMADLRYQYQSMGVGELGRLGDRVPDWRDAACDITVRGMDACDVENYILDHYENVLWNHYYPYKSEAMRAIRDVERDVGDLLGRGFGEGLEMAQQYYDGSPERGVARSSGMIVTAGQSTPILEQAARDLELVLDSVTMKEIRGHNLSSGRAKQLAFYLAYVESAVEAEVTRAELDLLDVKVISAADAIREMRRAAHLQRVSHY